MTYCVGWVLGDAVYLVADSAATSSTIPVVTQSSFGQSHRVVRGEYVDEGLLKLAPVGRDAAIAYAGDVEAASKVLEFLIDHWLMFNGDLVRLQKALRNAFSPSFDRWKVSLLLALCTEVGPQLVRWGPVLGFEVQREDQCSIGSLSAPHRALVESVLKELRRINPPKEDVLPVVSAFIQSLGVHDDLIEHNVGGAVVGLQLDSDGIAWQPDTAYFLLGRCPEEVPDFIRVGVRDDALVVQSSITEAPMVLMNSAVPSWQKWHEKWNQIVASEYLQDHYPFVVFIRKDVRSITVIRRTPGREGRYMRFRPSNDVLHLECTLELSEILSRQCAQPPLGPPFDLVCLQQP